MKNKKEKTRAEFNYDLYKGAPENSEEAILFFDAHDLYLLASSIKNRGSEALSIRKKAIYKHKKAWKLRELRLENHNN